VTDERINAGVEAAKQIISQSLDEKADLANLVTPLSVDNPVLVSK